MFQFSIEMVIISTYFLPKAYAILIRKETGRVSRFSPFQQISRPHENVEIQINILPEEILNPTPQWLNVQSSEDQQMISRSTLDLDFCSRDESEESQRIILSRRYSI